MTGYNTEATGSAPIEFNITVNAPMRAMDNLTDNEQAEATLMLKSHPLNPDTGSEIFVHRASFEQAAGTLQPTLEATYPGDADGLLRQAVHSWDELAQTVVRSNQIQQSKRVSRVLMMNMRVGCAAGIFTGASVMGAAWAAETRGITSTPSIAAGFLALVGALASARLSFANQYDDASELIDSQTHDNAVRRAMLTHLLRNGVEHHAIVDTTPERLPDHSLETGSVLGK